MSNPLAIASVTAILKRLIRTNLDRAQLNLNGAFDVTAKPPDQIQPNNAPPTNNLNLYLWKVVPNAGYSNLDLPSRNSAGRRIGNQSLSLDLFYVMSASGAEELNAEILLGYGMQILHDQPGMSPTQIDQLINETKPTGDPRFPNLLKSNLADQIESLKISRFFPKDDLPTKLWPALNTPLRMSAYYQISLVLTEVERSLPIDPPILSTKSHIAATERTVIDRIGVLDAQNSPTANWTASPQPGAWIEIVGQNLKPNPGRLRLASQAIDLSGIAGSQNKLRLQIPPNARIGASTVLIESQADFGEGSVPRLRAVRTSAPYLLSIVPEVTAITARADPSSTTTTFNGELELEIATPLTTDQTVSLTLMPPADAQNQTSLDTSVEINSNNPKRLKASVSGIARQTYIYQLTIDGAGTPFLTDQAGLSGPTIALAGGMP